MMERNDVVRRLVDAVPEGALRQVVVDLLMLAPVSPAGRTGEHLSVSVAPAKAATPRPNGAAAPAPAIDTWLTLREQVRERRLAEGLTNAALGAAIGYSPASVEAALTKRQVAPSAPLQAKLREWLEARPAEAMPFRANGAAGPGTTAEAA